MRVTEIFKSQSEEERRRAVTNMLIRFEQQKYKYAVANKQPDVG